MLNNEQISQICTELGLDPTDPASRKTIERLAQARPNVPINDHFISLLREDIQTKAAQTAPLNQNITSSLMNKVLASALVVMIALAAGGLWYIQNRTDQPLFQTGNSSDAGELLSGEYGITGVAEESFGELNKVAIVNKSENASGGSNSTAAAPTMYALGSDMAMSSEEKLIAPADPYQPTEYSFKYVGGDMPKLQEKQSVLKRAATKQSTSFVGRVISMLSFGLIDLGKFSDTTLQSIAFVEDKPNGYAVNIDMVNGNVSLNQDWERSTANNCYENCPEVKPLAITDLPEDSAVIVETDKFLEKYGISKQAYGAPFVNENTWRIYYDALPADQKATFYVPEIVTVTYPLIIEGRKVYDESGYVSGLTLGYDVRQKMVVSMYDLTTKKFQKSSYLGVTDSAKVLEVAERGGFRNYSYPYTDQPNVKKVQLELDTPTVTLVKMWYTDPNATRYSGSGELYVPSLVFPVKNWQATGYWRQNIIVPLVQDILNSDYVPEPIPMPMPVDPGIGDGSGAGTPAVTEPAARE